MTDTLPDGMTYVDGSARSDARRASRRQPDGTTEIVWDACRHWARPTSGTITFQATVDTTWEDAPVRR